MLIRPGTPHDALAIATVHVSAWQTTYAGLLPKSVIAAQTIERREAMWRQATESTRNDATRGLVLVAEDPEAGIVGFASAGREREEGTGFDAELYAIYLLEAHQGRGVGRSLVNQAVLELKAMGHASMRVWVLEGNPAERFYSRLGGTRVAEKQLDMGGHYATEIAYGWPDLRSWQ